MSPVPGIFAGNTEHVHVCTCYGCAHEGPSRTLGTLLCKSFSSSFRTGPATECGIRLASSSDPPVSTLHKPGVKEGTTTPRFLHGCCYLIQFLMLVQQVFLLTEPFLQLEKKSGYFGS